VPHHEVLVGVDVGTTRVKALAVDVHGHVHAESARPTPWQHSGAQAQIDPRTLADTVRAVLTELAQHLPDATQVLGVGVAGMAETGILLDSAGHPVAPALAWHDPRGRADLVEAAVGRSTFHRTVGMRLNSKPSVSKILWLQENVPTAASATMHLSVGEWIVYDLGGEAVSEVSLLSRTGLYDVVRQVPWQATLDLTGPLLPERRIVAGEACGVVDTSLPPAYHGAVLTVAGMDHHASALACGAARTGVLFDSLGTAEALLRFVPGPLEPDAIEALVDRDYAVMWSVVPGMVVVLGALLTGLSLQRIHSALGVESMDDRRALAEQALVTARGAVRVSVADHTGVSLSGIDDSASPGAIWRAAVEDLTDVSAQTISHIEAAIGPRTSTLIAGGWIHDAMVRQARTEILGAFQTSEVAEAGAMGAAFLAGIACDALERPGMDTAPTWRAPAT
jgi:sugar (pentulose or hexulose) kinase